MVTCMFLDNLRHRYDRYLVLDKVIPGFSIVTCALEVDKLDQ